MLRWIILIIIGWLVYRFLQRILASSKIPQRTPPKEIEDEMVQDPVCKIYVPKRQALVLHGLKEENVYFCSAQCRDKFIEKDSL